MTIDELKEAKDKLAKDVIELAVDFEALTSIKVRGIRLHIPAPIDIELEENKYRMCQTSEPSCVIDLVV